MNLSAVIPTINSSQCIARTIKHIENYLKKNKNVKQYEIIPSAQTSTDETWTILKKLSSKTVRPLFTTEKGKGIGLTKGIQKARYEWVLMIDDDLSYPIEFLDAAIPIADHYDILIGSRYIQSQTSLPFKRYILSKGYRTLVQTLFCISQQDIQAGQKLIRTSVMQSIMPKEKGYVWDTELLYHASKRKLRIREIPIQYAYIQNQLRARYAVPRMLGDVLKLRLRLWWEQ